MLDQYQARGFHFHRVDPNFWWHYWQTYFSFLWAGLVWGDYLISEFPDRRKITITAKDFGTNYIPEGTASTFVLQNDLDFINDDSPDHLWFNILGNQNSLHASNLFDFDYTRTVVKNGHTNPYDIYAIGLLRSGVVLTPAQIDKLHADFELWIFWSGVLNDYGYFKDNRFIP